VHTVAVPLIDGVAPFEFGVLCEVFGIDRTEEGVPPIEFLVCAEQPGVPLRTSVGAAIVPEHGLAELARADLVAVPAFRIRDEYPAAVLDAVRAAAERGAIIL